VPAPASSSLSDAPDHAPEIARVLIRHLVMEHAMSKMMLKSLLGLGMDRRRTLDTLLEHYDQELFGLQDLVEPPDAADPRHPFTSMVPEAQHSVANLSVRERFQPILLPLVAAMKTPSGSESQNAGKLHSPV
jgi:hypothetical protein